MGFLGLLIAVPLVSFSVDGNRFFSDRELLAVTGLSRGETFRRPLLTRAAWSLEDLYREKGFLDVSVMYEVRDVPGGKAVRFLVREGPRYRIQNVVVEDPGPLLDSRSFLRKFPRGTPLDVEVLSQREREIVRFYQDRGYPFVTLDREMEKTANATVILRYRLEAGPYVIVADVRGKTDGGLSLRRIVRATGMRPPEPFRQSRVEEALRNLYRMTVVQSASYRTETLTVRPDTLFLRMVFEVQERRPRFIRIGTGFQSPDRLQGTGGGGHRNLLGNGQELELLATGALRFSEMDRFSYEQIGLSYREPFFLGFNVASFLQLTYLLDLDRLTREVSVSWSLEKSWWRRLFARTTLSWRKNFTGQAGITNTLEQTLTYEGRDNPLDPREGTWFFLGHTHAGGILQGDHTFERSVLDLRRYVRISRDLTLAGRFRGGIFWGLPEPERIALVDLFTLGGDGSLRGYPLNGVGTFRVEGSAFRYGTVLANASLELRLRGRGIRVGGIRIPLGAVLFWDAGVLDQRWPVRAKVRHSLGLGLRLHSLAVPLRLDLAEPLPEGNPQVIFALGHMF